MYSVPCGERPEDWILRKSRSLALDMFRFTCLVDTKENAELSNTYWRIFPVQVGHTSSGDVSIEILKVWV